jgi:hypothetical protein
MCRLCGKGGRILAIQNCVRGELWVSTESIGVRFSKRVFEGSAVRSVQVDRYGFSEDGVVLSSETSG